MPVWGCTHAVERSVMRCGPLPLERQIDGVKRPSLRCLEEYQHLLRIRVRSVQGLASVVKSRGVVFDG